MLFELAYPSYLPSLVGREGLVAAHARLSASRSLSEVGGPGLAAVLVQAISAPFVLLSTPSRSSARPSACRPSAPLSLHPSGEGRSTSGARWPRACGRRSATGCSVRALRGRDRTTCAGGDRGRARPLRRARPRAERERLRPRARAGAAGGPASARSRPARLIRRLGMGPAVISCAVVLHRAVAHPAASRAPPRHGSCSRGRALPAGARRHPLGHPDGHAAPDDRAGRAARPGDLELHAVLARRPVARRRHGRGAGCGPGAAPDGPPRRRRALALLAVAAPVPGAHPAHGRSDPRGR
jgi:hypothetical protein